MSKETDKIATSPGEDNTIEVRETPFFRASRSSGYFPRRYQVTSARTATLYSLPYQRDKQTVAEKSTSDSNHSSTSSLRARIQKIIDEES